MSVTFDVSRGDRSSDASDEHSLNMPRILVTFDVSRGDRSSDVSDQQ